MRDYPEFYDSFGGVSEAVDAISRWGFYPGAPYGVLSSMFGASIGKAQYGEVMPAWIRTGVDTIVAAFPEQSQPLLDIVFPDRFREFLTALEVSRMNGEGIRILEKRMKNQALLPEEERMWAQASRGIATYGLLAEQTALFRFRPEERNKVFEAANQLLELMTGIPADTLNDLRKMGLRVEDVFPGIMTPEIHRAMNMLEGWSRYTGASVVLQPSRMGQQLLINREFWQQISTFTDGQTADRVQMEESIRNETNEMVDWLALKEQQNAQRIGRIESLKETNDRYREVPLTLEQRREQAEKFNMVEPMDDPMSELRQLYYEYPLEIRYDYDAEAYLPDWDSMFLYREMMENAVPDDIMQRLKDLNAANDTPLDGAHREANETFFRPYYAVFDAVIQQYDDVQKRQIIEHRRTSKPERRLELQEITTIGEGGETVKLISDFSRKVRQVHENMRASDPELDAWLLFFTRVRVASSPEASERLGDIRRRYGFPS